MSYAEAFRTSKKTVLALAAAGLTIGTAGTVWAVQSQQSALLAAFFGCLAGLTPAVYYGRIHGLDQRMRELEVALVYKELLDQVNDAILVMECREPNRIVEANRTACERLGYTREELLGLGAGDIADVASAAEWTPYLLSAGRLAKGISRELEYRTKDGRLVPVELHLRLIRLNGRRAFLAMARDLSERKEMESRIRHMAYHDDLTGLPNRRLFRERLEQAMRATRGGGAGLAVLYLDIDRFKLVNDSFGHEYGDLLLVQVAERFTRCIREEDYLARTEGDEFALFHRNVDSDDEMAKKAEQVAEALLEPFTIGEYQIHITASIGMARFTGCEEDVDADALMKHADIALSRSKESGKNNFQAFHNGMHAVSLKRLTLENEMRRAIQRNEFQLYYQPQLDTESGTIVGMEALIRWNHPERGMISPEDFIPIAEETGLIVPIGDWVIREACKQNRAWQLSGIPPVPVSVNLSMRQFLQMHLKERIRSILEETGLPPRYLELEITESMTMDVEVATAVLRELKELGVKISIDDFGTGYSSLYLLKRFPIDKLKIDRSFVRDIMVDPNDAAIVATIISMTRHLNLKVIAEGVETEEQLDFLHRNQCNEVQGYWFSPPVTAGRFQEMMRLHQGRLPGGGSESVLHPMQKPTC
ncbi:putative bifunctional diguanylate cyclase/phosphodiesterase [Gorillibacterium sp. sgz5001074]|uniref:putative bifunctional diguanylate cyclase/phosphodiesterase n=1 Tax=Gorillibacterium sp. sgz5001074 TaxID=3446695 RepID=UPI003F67A2F8